MASLPGIRFDITGTTGTTGFLSPKASWRAYVFPRGAYASQDTTGLVIQFDSSAVPLRFANNQWIQVGLSTANIRQINAVGTTTILLSGSNVTVSENDRIYLIGNTQPTVSGGSATYTTPATIIRQRDDDGSDLYTNSMITSDSNGLIQFFAAPNYYDCIIQDGNQSNQGSIVDLAIGAVDGISTSRDALFGASVTVNGALGVTGWATFGSTVTMNAAIGVTGWATFGSTVTMNSTLGVTGWATFGSSVTLSGAIGITGTATFGSTVTFQANITGVSVTGAATFGSTVTFNGDATFGRSFSHTGKQIRLNRLGFRLNNGAIIGLSTGWGNSRSSIAPQPASDAAFMFGVGAYGAGAAANPTVTVTFPNGTYGTGQFMALASRSNSSGAGAINQPTIPFIPDSAVDGDILTLTFGGTPVSGQTYYCNVLVVGISSQ